MCGDLASTHTEVSGELKCAWSCCGRTTAHCLFVCLRCQLLERVHAASNGRNPMRGLMAQWRGVDGAQWRGLEAPDEQQVLALEVRQEWGECGAGVAATLTRFVGLRLLP